MIEKHRDSERIGKILNLFQEIWELNPDMRFYQLIDLLQHEYSSKNNEFGKREGFEIDSQGYKLPISYIDLFYLEDEDLERFLEEYIDDHKS